MGNSSVSLAKFKDIHPKQSCGYPVGNELLKQIAEKASNTFPPKYTGIAQTGNVESIEGNRAVITGRAQSYGTNNNYPSVEMLEKELGGIEGLFTLFGCHYMRMMNDPRMNVLFDSSYKDTAESALEHGKRIACALLDRWYGTKLFATLGREYSWAPPQVVRKTHKRAKQCPMRPAAHQTDKFTTTQRDAWVGHVVCSAKECQTSEEFQQILGSWLRLKVDEVYGPFQNDYDETKDLKLIMKEEKIQQSEKNECVYYPSMSSGIFGVWLYNETSLRL